MALDSFAGFLDADDFGPRAFGDCAETEGERLCFFQPFQFLAKRGLEAKCESLFPRAFGSAPLPPGCW